MKASVLAVLLLGAGCLWAQDATTLRDTAYSRGSNGDAAYKLGTIYQERRLYSHAVRWYRLAAKENHRPAHLALARMILKGEGAAPNRFEAGISLALAAEEIPEAATEFAAIRETMSVEETAELYLSLYKYYTRGKYYPKKAPEKSTLWLRKAADSGNPEAQRILGLVYLIGRDVGKDEAEGLRWCRKAAAQNFRPAFDDMAVSFRMGRGVVKDEAEALKWNRRSAELGSSIGQYWMGKASEKGTGRPKNMKEAVKWYRLAADQGSSPSAAALARCYRLGDGVDKDPVEAAKWADIAVRLLKSKFHQSLFESILKQLTPGQVGEARKLADEWKKQPSAMAAKKNAGSEKAAVLVLDDPDLGSPVIVIPMAVSRDGHSMVTVSQFKNPDPLREKDRPVVDALESWDTTTMTHVQRSGITGNSHVKGVVNRSDGVTGPFLFSPDGKLLLAGSKLKGTVIDVFRMSDFEKIGTLRPPGSMSFSRLGVPCAAFTAAGDQIFTALATRTGGCQVWNTADLTLVREFDMTTSELGICLSPDEKALLTAEGHNRVHLWDAATGRQLAEFHPQKGILNAAAFHPSGSRIAFAGESSAAMLDVIREDGNVRFDHGKVPRLTGFTSGSGGIRSIAFSPDGRLLATADAYDKLLRVFDAETGRAVTTVPQPGLGPVLFTHDSKAVWIAGPTAPQRFEVARPGN